MLQFRYKCHGIRVISDIQIPEWATFEAVFEGAADAALRICETLGEPRPTTHEYRFFVDDVGWFSIRDGSEIFFMPESVPISRRMHMFLTGSAWGALLYQRGKVPLHASALQIGEGAVLFAGRRGQGKSTLAALLTERGFRLVSDDLCCVDVPAAGVPVVYPSVPRFKLCTDSIDQLGWQARAHHPDHARANKLHYFLPSMGVSSPLPIWGIYLLNWGTHEIERVSGFAALRKVFHSASWRGDLLLGAGDPAEHFRRCTELVRQIPVWDYSRPREFAAMSSAADRLVLHLTQNEGDWGSRTGLP